MALYFVADRGTHPVLLRQWFAKYKCILHGQIHHGCIRAKRYGFDCYDRNNPNESKCCVLPVIHLIVRSTDVRSFVQQKKLWLRATYLESCFDIAAVNGIRKEGTLASSQSWRKSTKITLSSTWLPRITRIRPECDGVRLLFLFRQDFFTRD
jgi:hypothetical protein